MYVGITVCRIDNWREVAVQQKELNLVLCDDLDGWKRGWRDRRKAQEGQDIYTNG